MLKKYKPDGEIEFRPVYFNSTTKTVIRHKLTGLMKDLVGLLNQSSLSTLKSQLTDHYQELLV